MVTWSPWDRQKMSKWRSSHTDQEGRLLYTWLNFSLYLFSFISLFPHIPSSIASHHPISYFDLRSLNSLLFHLGTIILNCTFFLYLVYYWHVHNHARYTPVPFLIRVLTFPSGNLLRSGSITCRIHLFIIYIILVLPSSCLLGFLGLLRRRFI